MTVAEACRAVVEKLPEDTGGVIAVNKYGHHCIDMNSEGMFRARCTSSGSYSVGIWENEKWSQF